MSPPQGKPGEPLTFGDRVVTALVGGICGFGTMVVVWFLVIYFGGRTGSDVMLPFYWTWIVAGVVAALAFLAGPERTMDTFETVWGWFGIVLFWRSPRSDEPTRRRRR